MMLKKRRTFSEVVFGAVQEYRSAPVKSHLLTYFYE